MIVHRSHFEHAPPGAGFDAGIFEIIALNHDRSGFGDKHHAHHWQQNPGLRNQRHNRQRRAQRQRAGIAHKHLGGMGVEPQKRHTRAAHRKRIRHQKVEAIHKGDNAERSKRNRQRPAGQAVHAVGEINRVRHRYNNEGRQRNVPVADVDRAIKRHDHQAAVGQPIRFGQIQCQRC